MNTQSAKGEIAEIYLKRIIEQNKPQYAKAYESGKKAIYLILAQRDATIHRLQEIISHNKRNDQIQHESNGTPLSTQYNQNWTWVSKIIYALLEKKAPMLSQEMIAYLTPLDEKMRASHDRVGYFSAFLTKAVKNNRVVQVKVKGFKGYFYALPEWIINGELPPSYYQKMNLLVSQ